MSDPLVSVVVPVLDGGTGLARCLDALHGQSGSVPFEVVVADNGSRDGSADLARAHPVSPEVVTEPRRGSYAARNAGIAVARGGFVAFTDADCIPVADWVVQGVAALESASVIGGQVHPHRSAQPSVWERYDSAIYLQQEDLVRFQGYAATANLWVRREVLDVVGGFDPDLQSSGDLEWGHRAAASGFPTAYGEEVIVEHAPRTTAAQTWRLHRRLGAGWAVLREDYPELREALSLPLGAVIDAVAADGPALRRRQLAPVHLVASAARRYGWLSQRTSRRARTEP
ncbi:MAG: glycosyl transferase, group 2 family protein [Frankiales bacterium]|nr:glycosyl transferase, group 2 family protein [Frankiales bacterium]